MLKCKRFSELCKVISAVRIISDLVIFINVRTIRLTEFGPISSFARGVSFCKASSTCPRILTDCLQKFKSLWRGVVKIIYVVLLFLDNETDVNPRRLDGKLLTHEKQ